MFYYILFWYWLSHCSWSDRDHTWRRNYNPDGGQSTAVVDVSVYRRRPTGAPIIVWDVYKVIGRDRYMSEYTTVYFWCILRYLTYLCKTFIKSSVVAGICHSTRPCIFSVFWEIAKTYVKVIGRDRFCVIWHDSVIELHSIILYHQRIVSVISCVILTLTSPSSLHI